ncbi:hypothetical protein PTSG_04969 [Salpingoeca rosetta]|uniref:Uncharacterized protein n=1 Tax=Salpingoeca rosetta (strain ATCC 50818 / BSB-021) TaxID=946362 RepID=F2U953_SALR5|nr:uncharacterized protein PTSG_04969 [Salpingoeca rosetta]EGD73256.1 hypothetical protein PTSG_04969 [Salpingoeca rosetta]|eukprot:XP_004994287.1 hypothetical protein PTSG_04969 [Salpingoeca rosetta]
MTTALFALAVFVATAWAAGAVGALGTATPAGVDGLVEWARAQGAVIAPAVAIRTSPLTGNGVYATADMKAHTTVFAVPFSLMMNVEHALVDPDLGRLWDMLPDLSDLEVLAGFLAFESLRGTGFWQPYLASLGPPPTTPTLFSQEEMDLLAPSAAVFDIAQQRHLDLSEVYDLIVKAATNGLNKKEKEAWQQLGMRKSDYLWAHVVLRSRSHKLSIKDAVGQWHDAMCLVPLADLFNTDLRNNTANVACYTGEEGHGTASTFYCETTRDINHSEELLVEYIGDAMRRSSGKLLLDYGFVPTTHDSDSVLLHLPKLSETAEQRLKHFHFREYEPLPWLENSDACLKLRLVIYFAIDVLDKNGFDISDDFKVSDKLLSERLRRDGLDRLLEHISDLNDAYPNHGDGDGNGDGNGDGTRGRSAFPAGVRADVGEAILRLQQNEQRILQRALDVCTAVV